MGRLEEVLASAVNRNASWARCGMRAADSHVFRSAADGQGDPVCRPLGVRTLARRRTHSPGRPDTRQCRPSQRSGCGPRRPRTGRFSAAPSRAPFAKRPAALRHPVDISVKGTFRLAADDSCGIQRCPSLPICRRTVARIHSSPTAGSVLCTRLTAPLGGLSAFFCWSRKATRRPGASGSWLTSSALMCSALRRSKGLMWKLRKGVQVDAASAGPEASSDDVGNGVGQEGELLVL